VSGQNGEVPNVAPRAVPHEDYGFEFLSLEQLRQLWRERSVSTESPAAARADYVRLTALRTELFSRLEAPASVKKWGGDRK
jgi:hypothetical protein